jgi:hypothetical protein
MLGCGPGWSGVSWQLQGCIHFKSFLSLVNGATAIQSSAVHEPGWTPQPPQFLFPGAAKSEPKGVPWMQWKVVEVNSTDSCSEGEQWSRGAQAGTLPAQQSTILQDEGSCRNSGICLTWAQSSQSLLQQITRGREAAQRSSNWWPCVWNSQAPQ